MNTTRCHPNGLGNVNSCFYVGNHLECEGGGYISYTSFIYCIGDYWYIAAIILTLLLLAQLFLALSVSADSFFCPCLAVIVDHLKISQNIAGVTFLAFGNGAPDIFSSIASVLSTDTPKPGLAFGALLGAGVFLTTVIPALITLLHPFDVMRRPLLRDILFYLLAVAFTFYIFYNQQIHTWQAIAFISLYAIYAFVVVIGRFVRKKVISKQNDIFTTDASTACIADVSTEENNISNSVSRVILTDDSVQSNSRFINGPRALARVDSIFEEAEWHYHRYSAGISDVPEESEQEEEEQENDSQYLMFEGQARPFFLDFWIAIRPFSVDQWKNSCWYERLLWIFKAPILFLLNLTIPLVNPDIEKHNWSKPLTMVQAVLCPVFAMSATQQIGYLIAGIFPLAAVFVLLGLVVAILICYFTNSGKRPKFHNYMAYAGFLMAVLWIYSLAREVVGIVTTIGVVTNLSNEILGLTLLAWSNSLGDLISDLTVAKKGFPRMAISACFGGPLFNLLIGIGVSYTIATVHHGRVLPIDSTGVPKVLLLFLGWSLLSSLILVPLSRFHVSRPYALYLITIYISFLIVVILTEKRIIAFPSFKS